MLDSKRPTTYISKRRIRQAHKQISPKALKVLETIIVHKAMLTNQVTRICIGEKNDNNARTSMRLLNSLLGAKLVRATPYTAKFSGYAVTTWSWEPTNLGIHVGAPDSLREVNGKPKYLIKDESKQADKLEHILQITETEAILRDHARIRKDFSIIRIECEPACWRKFEDRHSADNWLKPDVFFKSMRKVDGKRLGIHYFVEVDRASEELKRIIGKCEVYRNYFRNVTKEQLCCGKIPLVVWIVPTEKRKESINARLIEKMGEDVRLFDVITRDEVAEFFTNWRQTEGGGDE